MRYICTTCGSTKHQVIADARTLSLKSHFQNGLYSCCQITAWADEQWLAWLVAAEQDGKWADDVTRPLECEDTEAVAPIAMRRNCNGGLWDR